MTLENVEVTHLPKGITLVVLAVLSIGAGFTGLIIAFLLFGIELHKRIDLKKFKLESPINLIKDLSSNVLYLNKFGISMRNKNKVSNLLNQSMNYIY